jgi:DNA-binding LacI/PurR family transcriptional regulator
MRKIASLSVTPMTRDVEALLRERIQSGRYSVGGRLPSEREICEELKVHRRVVRAAIKILEREGMVSRRPNCRPIVASRERLEYHAPISSSSSSLQASQFVALVMLHGEAEEEGGTGQQRIFWGMNQTLAQAGYHTVFLDLGEAVGEEGDHVGQEDSHLEYALKQGFGGIVFYCISYYSNHTLLRKIARQIPLVLIDRQLTGFESDFVGVTNREGMYEATKHLIDLGHKRIAYMTRPEPINTVQDRLQGYIQALRDEFHSNFYQFVLCRPSESDAIWPVFESIARLPAEMRPTAIVCVNDYEAVNATNYLMKLGFNVPGDISIIGCDNIITKLPNGVGLTTIAQPFEEIGNQAAKLFLRRVNGRRNDIERVECATKLIIRDSCRRIEPGEI